MMLKKLSRAKIVAALTFLTAMEAIFVLPTLDSKYFN